MIYLELFWSFLRVSCFAFGGAYSAIPLVRDVVLSHGWLTDESLTYMIAVSESTPGPIMVNLATYVGSSQAGFLGAVLATTAVILPSFVIILLAMVVLKTVISNPYVQAVLEGLKPCIIGIILATGVYMCISNCLTLTAEISVDFKAGGILVLLLLLMAGAKFLAKKAISPIMLILISACLGIIIYH